MTCLHYRLGLDVGTNSIGAALWELDEQGHPTRFVDAVARVFSPSSSAGRHPKSRAPLAAERRVPRGARRNRDRKLGRQRHLLRVLTANGLMPQDEGERREVEALNPWILRYRAVQGEAVPLHHVGRALFHLAQRRGFKSNRKTDGADAKETGKVYDGIAKAREVMAQEAERRGAPVRTLGELFGYRMEKARETGRALPTARVRLRGSGRDEHYSYYPSRDLVREEFDLIWDVQSPHHPEMTDALRDTLHGDDESGVIFHQRPLKSPEPGRCTLLPGEPRAPRALPSVERFRIVQDVNNLMIRRTGEAEQALDDAQREVVVRKLTTTQKQTFDAMRKALSLPTSARFNLETSKRTKLKGAETDAALKGTKLWGRGWLDLSLEDRDAVVERLIDSTDADDLAAELRNDWNLSAEQSAAVARFVPKTGFGHLSLKAIRRLLPHMEAGLSYDRAVQVAGLGAHSQRDSEEVGRARLPYYGEVLGRHVAFGDPNPGPRPKARHELRAWEEKLHGRIANPTVHAALKEIGKVVNAIIDRYGTPHQIVIEMARELPKSDRGLRELERRQADNQAENERRRERLAELGHRDTYDNRLRLRLWEDMPAMRRECVYSGERITETTNLFSSDIVIDHVLPFSRSLDDGYANKVLCTRAANDHKGNRTPYECWGPGEGAEPSDVWTQISARAEGLPDNKQWRFGPGAMDRFDADSGFAAHHLVDTGYIARLAKRYVESLYGGQGAPGQPRSVWVTTGRLTSDLRHYAGLNHLLPGGNRKDRTDHRHHALDAAVIGFIDMAMVKAAADMAKREDIGAFDTMMRFMAEHDPRRPNPNANPLGLYAAQIDAVLSRITVSHKPDHGHQAQMHEATALGDTGEVDDKNQHIMATRKHLRDMKRSDLDRIVDPALRAYLREQTQELEGTEFVRALVQAGEQHRPQPIRRVRLHYPMKEASLVRIEHGDPAEPGTPYTKAYKGGSNYCYDIFMGHDGKWTGEIVTTFQAYQLARKDPRWWRKPVGLEGQPIIMRLRKGDMLELDVDGPDGRERRIMRVFKFSNVIDMAPHNEANASSRITDGSLDACRRTPGSLQRDRAIRVTVDPSGAVRRHGTPPRRQ